MGRMTNREVAEIFDRMANILEFQGEMQFKVNAYRKAAQILKDLARDISEMDEKELMSIPGIGEKLARKIHEYVTTGKIRKYEELKREVPPGVIDLMEIPGLGPKTVRILYEKAGVKDIDTLKKAIDEGRLLNLPRMGPRTIEKIKKGIQLFESMKGRTPIGEALPLAETIIESIKNGVEVSKIMYAGSLRRFKETVGDIDILAIAPDGRKVIDFFVSLPMVEDVLAHGDTKGSVILKDSKIQVDLRVVPEDSFGAALQYFTGSKQHNIHLRTIAREKGLKISEYGIFKGGQKIGGKEEREIYEILGMQFIPPEMREDTGEIELALAGMLPAIIDIKDIRGDLHVHSKYSDGTATIQEIKEAAARMGYQYVAITDHSPSQRIAHGLDVDALKRKKEEIEKINRTPGPRILFGTEVDILRDGTLDYPEEVLKEFDFVVASIHSGFNDPEDVMTRRIISAIENPYVDIIAHPTGRLIGEREPYRVDLDKVMEYARKYDKALEINSYYKRLDLNDLNSRKAVSYGVKISIATDAHHLDHLPYMRFGVGIARRGWVPPDLVVNSWEYDKLIDWIKSHRKGK